VLDGRPELGFLADGGGAIGIGVEHEIAARRRVARANSLPAPLVVLMPREAQLGPAGERFFQCRAHAVGAAVIHHDDLIAEPSA
jgi:hypothetical protein